MMRVFVIFFSLEKCSRIVSACASYSALPGVDAFVFTWHCDLWSCQAANDKRVAKNSASYLQARMRKNKCDYLMLVTTTVHMHGILKGMRREWRRDQIKKFMARLCNAAMNTFLV